MEQKKTIGYIAAVIIGIGFIIMAVSDTLHNQYASIIQAILGVIFIIFGIKKIIEEQKKK